MPHYILEITGNVGIAGKCCQANLKPQDSGGNNLQGLELFVTSQTNVEQIPFKNLVKHKVLFYQPHAKIQH